MTVRPYQSALYSSCLRNSDQDASEIARAREWFLSMLRTVRSSMITVWFSRMILVDNLCRKSVLRSVIRAYTRETLTRALARLREPFCLRARFRCAFASRARSRFSHFGLVIFSPVDRVTSDVIPASTQTADAGAGGSGSIVSSTRRETCHRPVVNRPTVTVDGSAHSGGGRDQRISSGTSIFASVICPSR